MHSERSRFVDVASRAEARLAGERQLLEMVASGKPLAEVLAALCAFVEDIADDCHCGIYLIDWSGPTFEYGVAPTLPASYLDPIKGLPVRSDVAPCGIAAFEKCQVIVEDIETDPRWNASSYQSHVLGHGLRAVWSTPVYSLDGKVLGTFCVYQRKPAIPTAGHQELIAQVTHIASIAIERTQAEMALKRSETFLAEAQRLSLTGSFSWGVTTNEVTWSEQLYRTFEIDSDVPVTLEMIGSRFHPDDLGLLYEIVARAREKGDDLECEFRLQLPDGTIKYLHMVARGTRDHRGRLEYIGALQDVTERRLSEEALSRARQELTHVARVTSLGALTASIAHEVNQPLSGIITNANTCLRMLASNPPNVDGARETARRTIRDGNRASDVITRLRALFERRKPVSESVNLNDATREVLELSSSELRRNRVVVRAELAEDLPVVAGDRVQLQQVIQNLLRNASEAMTGVDGRPRQVTIRTECDEGDRVRLTVQDAGGGFAPHGAERVFDAFYTTKSGGMGIGLSVSRSIIESHDGHLWSASNDGPGATFAFSIPRNRAARMHVHSLDTVSIAAAEVEAHATRTG